MNSNQQVSTVPFQALRAGMVGMGMIFDETYRPFFENVRRHGLYDARFGLVDVSLAAAATRTGRRAQRYLESLSDDCEPFRSYHGADAADQLAHSDLDLVLVAAPDDRHFAAACSALKSGKHVLIEKPSVLSLGELDQLQQLAASQGRLAKVVYHKLFDPDHKRLRTLVVDGQLQHVNSGYCSLLEPKQISGQQFAEWIQGRNPGTYVAVHYIKLIDFTFGGQLFSVSATGQRGLVGPPSGDTWDSVQLQLVYRYSDDREAAFDIHTSWVTPDNFPGYVEQEVQFRFDNGVWLGHSRRRGVECTIEGQTPLQQKISLNNHFNGQFVEPDGRRTQRGYGIEVLEQFFREVAFVEFGREPAEREQRLQMVAQLNYNDVSSDRQVVAAVQAMEAILDKHRSGSPGCLVRVNEAEGGLVLFDPLQGTHQLLYDRPV